MDTDYAKHELQQKGDHHNVLDGGHGDNDGLYDSLEAFSSLDGAEGSEHSTDAEDLEHRDSTSAVTEDDGDDGHANHHHIEEIGRRPHVAAFLKCSICEHLQRDFKGEDGGEEVVKISQDPVSLAICVERILHGKSNGRYHDADQEEV